MKESIGYTVTLNIIIVFITIVMAFLCAALIYFKSNKVSNIITHAIEKYEGYTVSAVNEINISLKSVGYGSRAINCDYTVEDETAKNNMCNLKNDGLNGYCIYFCEEKNNSNYYFYKIRTNMMVTIPIIRDIIDIPVYSNTNRLYNFNNSE